MTRLSHRVEDHGWESPCWIWPGAINARGYGRAWGGPAHRVFYERHIGPIPKGLTLDHLCRVRRCVNPAHLEPVTHKENTRRGAVARSKGADSNEIRDLRHACGLSQADLARLIGVSQPLVALWERGKSPVGIERLGRIRALAGGRK